MSRRMVGAAAAAAVALAATGCEADGSASLGPSPAHGQASRSVTTGWSAASARGDVGASCDGIPATGPGRIAEVAPVPVVTALARVPELTRIARAIKATGLAGGLNSAKAITIFAPENRAFAALGRGNLTTLLGDKSDLTSMLKDHIVSGRLTPRELASGKHLTTLRGTIIIPANLHHRYRVNNAEVVCGAIQTANATIYIIDKVLVPIP